MNFCLQQFCFLGDSELFFEAVTGNHRRGFIVVIIRDIKIMTKIYIYNLNKDTNVIGHGLVNFPQNFHSLSGCLPKLDANEFSIYDLHKSNYATTL